MRTLNVTISDKEYSQYGIQKDSFSFSDFIDLIGKELAKQNLNKCVELANKYGLSSMNINEITNEIKAVRQNAKNRT